MGKLSVAYRASESQGVLSMPQRERSGSVVECLTQDRRFADANLTSGTALCPCARHINPCLALV